MHAPVSGVDVDVGVGMISQGERAGNAHRAAPAFSLNWRCVDVPGGVLKLGEWTIHTL